VSTSVSRAADGPEHDRSDDAFPLFPPRKTIIVGAEDGGFSLGGGGGVWGVGGGGEGGGGGGGGGGWGLKILCFF